MIKVTTVSANRPVAKCDKTVISSNETFRSNAYSTARRIVISYIESSKIIWVGMKAIAFVALVGDLSPFKPVIVPDALRVFSAVLLTTLYGDMPVTHT